MKKNNYEAPDMQVIKIEMEHLLAASSEQIIQMDDTEYSGEFYTREITLEEDDFFEWNEKRLVWRCSYADNTTIIEVNVSWQ